MSQWSDYPPELNPDASAWWAQVMVNLRKPTPQVEQAVATQAANAEVGEKAGELAGPEGNSRA